MGFTRSLKTVAFCILLSSSQVLAQEDPPLWLQLSDTISPAWKELIFESSRFRSFPLPKPDAFALWKKIQETQRLAVEATCVQTANAFNVIYEEREVGGVPVVIVTPKSIVSEEVIAVYLHGGAYVLSSAKAAMSKMAIFSNATGLRVYGIDYTLAPHSKWRETTDEVLAVFKALHGLGNGMDKIVLYGDSAGGGLAAGATLKMRDRGMGMPAALVLWSPWADVSGTGDTYLTLRDAEPYYTYENVLKNAALAYADEKDQKHPYVSPVHGDFSKGFPPTLIQGGTRELLLSDFVRLYQALDQAGQTVKLDIYEGMPHVHAPQLPDTPESKAAMAKVREWVTEHVIGR